MPRRSAQPLTKVGRASERYPAIFTIGHSTHPWQDFLELLRAHKIEQLVDVRTIPRSRHNPQFNREMMAEELGKACVAYVHLPNLGGLRHPRADSVNDGWRNLSFRGYADYMQTPGFEEGLKQLLQLGVKTTSAIMCAEALPWRCHRSLIADALTVRKIPVFHIAGKTSAPRHEMTSFAKVNGHEITYPSQSESPKLPF